MSLCYEIAWRLRFPAFGDGQASVRLAFPSVAALRDRSCSGTLGGRVVVPHVTELAGTSIIDGTCEVHRQGDALRFDARLPFRTERGAACLSVNCLTFGRPDGDSEALIRLEGEGFGAQEGMTDLHLPRFIANLVTEPVPAPSNPGWLGFAAGLASWPHLRTRFGQTGRLLSRLGMGIPDETLRFLGRCVGSVEQLDILLLLYREPERWFTPAAMADALYASVSSVERSLQHLNASKVADIRPAPELAYRFAAREPGVHDAMAKLVKSYRERRLAILTAIAVKPMDEVQSFANAFRFRPDKED